MRLFGEAYLQPGRLGQIIKGSRRLPSENKCIYLTLPSVKSEYNY